MTHYFRGRGWRRWALAGVALCLGCAGAPTSQPARAQAAVPPAPAATVAGVVRHFADLMAQGTALPTPASRHYAGALPESDLNATKGRYYLSLPSCDVEVSLDSTQRIRNVFVDGPARPRGTVPKRLSSLPADARLGQLGELRRVFGPGTVGTPWLTKMVFTRRFPVDFLYQPLPGHRKVAIRASMPIASYADSAQVHSITLFPR